MATTNIVRFPQNNKTANGQATENTQKKPSRRPASAATAINQHIRASVIRMLCDSCLKFRDFSRIAKYAGTREEIGISIVQDEIWDLREQVTELRRQLAGLHPPSGPGVIRRRAA